MDSNFIPAPDARRLATVSAKAMEVCGELIGMIVSDLPPEKQAALEDLVNGGGRVGLELTVDVHSKHRIALVGIEREGKHLTLATIAQNVTRGTH